jgi:Ni,Fe-hydrogenase maturation factor
LCHFGQKKASRHFRSFWKGICEARRRLPEDVSVGDFGVRGFDLAHALLDPWDTLILVDALSRGEVPGTLYMTETDMASFGNAVKNKNEVTR